MAVDMFMKIAGVTGESKDSTHAGEIDVLAWSWGVSNSASGHMGGGSGSGKANVQDMSFTKYYDKSSPVLLGASIQGDHYADATLVVRKAGKTPLEYIKIKMSQVYVTSISTGGSGGEDRLTENVSLNFSKVEIEYQAQKDSDGSKDGGPVKFGYNIATNKTA